MPKNKRSALMSKVRGKNTGIEKLFLEELKRRNISGFKRYGKVVGKPDFIFYRNKTVVFCDGDFWHGYRFNTWKDKLNKFWENKIENNIKRDRKVRILLKNEGWQVIRFWGHEINENTRVCVDKLINLMG
jgi:DNA mismatch endonuclease (patch repair protein)